MTKRPADRLRETRERAGFSSAAAFADAHELTESAYRHKENGTREITVQDAKRYAKLLAKKLGPTISWQYLIDGTTEDQPVFASVLGYVGAGEKVFPFDDEHAWEPVPAPPGMTTALAAVVKGGSMVPVFRDGDVLYFGPQETAASALVGKDCLVQVINGPRLIKKLVRGSKRNALRLHSYATGRDSDDIQIEWAAPVRWIERR